MSLPGEVQQLKLLPRVNTSRFLRLRVDVSPYLNPSDTKGGGGGVEPTR